MTAVALEATPSRARTWWALPALAAIVAGAGVWWSLAPYMVGVFHDDGVYALLARSIAAGQGFHYSHLPGAPAATHYPPLYPLLLAALWRMAPSFPANLGVLLGANAVLAGVAAAGFTLFATGRLAWRGTAAVAASVVVMMTTPMLTLAGALLSEILFLAMLWPALLLAERALDAPGRRAVVVAAVVIGLTMLVRTHALALLLALTGLLAARRRASDAAIALVVALAVQLPWVIWSRGATPHVAAPLEGSYGSYLGWFMAGLREGGVPFVADTARINARELGLLLRDRFTLGLAFVDGLALAMVLGVMITGAMSFVRRAPVTLAFFALYFAIVLVWPYSPWRFAWAVWPLAVMLALHGIRDMWTRAPRMRVIAGLVAALPALALLRTELHAYASRAWRVPARQAGAQLAPLVTWARDSTAPGDVLLVEGEQVVALYAGRAAAPPVSFTALEYVHPSDARVASSFSAMLHAVPATQVVTISPAVQRAAVAMRDSALVVRMRVAPAGLAAFTVVR